MCADFNVFRREQKFGSKKSRFSSVSKSVDTINSQILFLRKTRLNIFAPISDLSSLSRTGLEQRALIPGKTNDVAIAGGQILGDEYSRHVVKVSYQTIHLNIDFERG